MYGQKEDQEKFSGEGAVLDGPQWTAQLVTGTRAEFQGPKSPENCKNVGGLKIFLTS